MERSRAEGTGSSPTPWRVLAIALFLALTGWLSSTIPAWHEGVSVHPGQAVRVLESPNPDTAPEVRFEPSCAEREGDVLRSQTRPMVKLCLGGRRFPLMITPYASGIPYWPSVLAWSWHRGDVFALRWFGIALGLASLLCTAALVRRFGGPRLGNLAIVLVAVTPSFVFIHSTLIHYETMPWISIATGMLVLAGCPELAPGSASNGAPSWGRLLVAATCFAVGVLANLKAVFLLAPLLVVAWRAGVRFGQIDVKRWLGIAVVMCLVLLPMLVTTFTGPEAFEGQVDQRLAALVKNLRPAHVGAELLNVGLFGADMLWYLQLASGDMGMPNLVAVAVVVPSVLYCMAVAVRFIVRRRGSPVTAACGALLATFWLVSALLYDQWPAANHSPLSAVFGVAVACTAMSLANLIASRRFHELHGLRLVTITAVAFLGWSSVRRGSPETFVTASINAGAERALAEHLHGHAEPSGTLVTATYNLAGILESLGHGELFPVQAHHYLSCPDDDLGCLTTRLHTLATALPLPMRVVVPARAVPIDESYVSVLPEALRRATADPDLELRRETTITTTEGVEVLWLFRIDGSP